VSLLRTLDVAILALRLLENLKYTTKQVFSDRLSEIVQEPERQPVTSRWTISITIQLHIALDLG